MHRLAIGGRQPVRGIDGGVIGDVQEKKLASAGEQYLSRRSALVRRRLPRNISADQRIQHAEPPQCFADNGARETGVALREIGGGQNLIEYRIQWAPSSQHAAQD